MLTAVVLTHNEAANLPRCLSALQFCDQVVVVDDDSTDDTPAVAKKAGAVVLSHSLQGDFAAQRNWALENVKSPWVLFVDADEIVSSQLANEIRSAVQKTEYKGYFVPRQDYLWQQELKHGDVGSVALLRLGRRGAGKWVGPVHETWAIEGQLGRLKSPLQHYPHPHLVDFLKNINAYSTIKAHNFFNLGKRTNLFEISLGPPYRFLLNYVLKMGFLDGTAGFVHAMTMAFYAFLTLGKLWLLSKGIDEHKWVTSV